MSTPPASIKNILRERNSFHRLASLDPRNMREEAIPCSCIKSCQSTGHPLCWETCWANFVRSVYLPWTWSSFHTKTLDLKRYKSANRRYTWYRWNTISMSICHTPLTLKASLSTLHQHPRPQRPREDQRPPWGHALFIAHSAPSTQRGPPLKGPLLKGHLFLTFPGAPVRTNGFFRQPLAAGHLHLESGVPYFGLVGRTRGIRGESLQSSLFFLNFYYINNICV